MQKLHDHIETSRFNRAPDAPPPPPQRLAYGLQPGAGAVIGALAKSVAAAVGSCQSETFADAACGALRPYLRRPDLLSTDHQTGDPADVCRHLLYAHPAGLFSIQAIVWLPGQRTPRHGHTAWGAVGVHCGHPQVLNFEACMENHGSCVNLRYLSQALLKPGDSATVQPGIHQVHRIQNPSDDACVTIHVYGRDLLTHPRAVNIVFPE